MRHSFFSLMIPQGREFNGTGYVRMKHGTVYVIRIGNADTRRPCDAAVVVDGKPVGTWRLGPAQSARLEHPVDDTGRFTFHAADSPEARDGDVHAIDPAARGLVAVTFRLCVPKPVVRPVVPDYTDVVERPWRVPRPKGPFWDARLASSGGPTGGGESYASNHVSDGGVTRSAGPGGQSVRPAGMTANSTAPPAGAKAGITTLTGTSGQRYGIAEALAYDPDEVPATLTLRLVEDDGAADAKVRPLRPSSTPVPPPVE
jgi:hypothetical protein